MNTTDTPKNTNTRNNAQTSPKRKLIKKILVLLASLGIVFTQVPAVVQMNYQIFLPSLPQQGIVYYFPVVQNPPTQTPTTTPTPTLTPTATRTNTPLPPGVPPDYSSSYYMLTVNSTKLYNLGCTVGTIDKNLPGVRDTIVILDFGTPKQVNGEWGTDLFWIGPVTNAQIKAAVQNFGRGYYVCSSTDQGSQIYIAVGTTNYGSLFASSTETARALGVAWAQMINEINAWFTTNGYATQVHAVGANDIEPAWNGVAVTRAWVDGYDSVNLYDYYDFGSADGCATRSTPTKTTCANGWTRDDVWYKAYGTRPGFPIPEIYNTRGTNAEQWALLSLYSVNYKGYPIEYHGVLTQWQACQQVDDDQCAGVDNTPATGWLQLYNELAKDSRTFYTPRWSTDILWTFSISGDAVQPGALSSTRSAATMIQDRITRYQMALAQPKLDVTMKDALQEKLANAQRIQSDRAAAEAHPAVKNASQAPKAPAVEDAPFPVGIFEGPGGMIQPWEGMMINHWQGIIGGEYLLISAGNKAEDPTQGLVMVTRVSADRSKLSRQFFLTPHKAGMVQVAKVEGNTVVLKAENGTEFRFNFAALKFD